jgi:hypothetical protein
MPKQSGLGMRFFVDGYDIAGDVQTCSIRGGPAVLDLTGIDKSAYERRGGRRDGSMSAVAFWNPGALAIATPLVDTGSQYLLRPITLTDRIVTAYVPSIGDSASLVGKQGNYDTTLAADGALTSTLDVLANGYGTEWGDQLTAGKVTVAGAGALASIDFTAGTTFGAQAYLHVFDFTGTDATVAIQSSSDNGAGDAFSNVTGLVFDSIITDPQAQRKETGRTASIERYLRVNVTTTGGFSSLTFFVMVVKNKTSVLF